MKITIDNEANTAYIYLLDEGKDKYFPLKTLPVNEDINIDYAKDGKLFGIEILDLNLLELNKLENIKILKI